MTSVWCVYKQKADTRQSSLFCDVADFTFGILLSDESKR